MEIVLAAGGMDFGPTTLSRKSLGGSETAAINVATELRKLGHLVTIFCHLDCEPCFDEFGIRWAPIEQFHPFVATTEVDLLIVSRDLNLFAVNHQAKKAVLWNHDLAVYAYHNPLLQQVSWNFDEVWCLTQFHKKQWHKVTGYPLKNIKVTRNGITKVDTVDMGRSTNQLLFAARPERGLENLVRPGGIMSLLPEFELKVTMYDNYPNNMMGYYQQLWEWARQLPNVELLGPKTQQELRQLMRNSFAYVYPTDFEEVSCIIARECIEQQLPMICTHKAALPETLKGCGTFIFRQDVGSDGYNQQFANTVKELASNQRLYKLTQDLMAERKDLYWKDVAKQWVKWAKPATVKPYSRAWSLIEDSDVIPAIAYMEKEGLTDHYLYKQTRKIYPYLFGEESFESYYERYFKIEDEKGSRRNPSMVGNPRFEAIAAEINDLPDGSKIIDYGCAEGVIILDLADRFPNKHFFGIDFAPSNIELCKKYAAERNSTNVEFYVGSIDNWPDIPDYRFDAVICSEVMEHVTEPWKLTDFLESKVYKKAKVILTVPQGPWEASGLYDKRQWFWRAHIWHIDKWMLRTMYGKKKDCRMSYQSVQPSVDGRVMGHLIFVYLADQKSAAPIDPYKKALQHRARHSMGAALIVKNGAENIIRCLNSIHRYCPQINIAIAPSDDGTVDLISNWAAQHPWVDLKYIMVPAVEARKFGFDDARNASLEGLDTDFVLWIDHDEYLSGNPMPYIRYNAFDSYAIHQHHFTCEPRGTPAQMDKPARLFRNNGTFKFYGKVHEHAEKGFNGGPGHCFILPNVDIGHPGYVNEETRRLRFDRNFPLLEWDREVNPNRKLGHYLWLRDIIHRMRYYAEKREIDKARLLAMDAVSFYKKMWPRFDLSGMGGLNALAYHSEALIFLGKGIPLGITVKLDNEQLHIEGAFETPVEASKILNVALKGEFDKRKSKYWR